MSDSPRLLFVTSNGTGLGHLTRSMAIARRLGPDLEPLFMTFSAAAPVVAGLGFPVEYLASYDRPGAGNDLRWTRRSRARLEAAVAEIHPRLVVFDGTHPYERLLPALRSTGAPLVWCRRAMWRADSDTAPLYRSNLFDAVLEPGELAAEADRGPTVARRAEATAVAPIVLVDRSEQLPREHAAGELGLDPARLTALVQLGQGEGVREANLRALRHLTGRGDLQVAALGSALSARGEIPDGVIRLPATYPIARHFSAFDLAVAAAGYNAFHELIHHAIPTLFVPMARQTDDQAARARYADAHGLAVACTGPDDPALESALDDLVDRRTEIRDRLDSLSLPNGAEDAANLLAGGGVSGTDAAPPAVWRRRWIFVKSVPRTIARIGGQILTRPRTRVVVVALGEDGEAQLASTLAEINEKPERILVVTDRLEFGPLLAAGVGFEHLPARGERQAQLAGGSYEEFARRRLALILAERPRPRRVIEIGNAP